MPRFTFICVLKNSINLIMIKNNITHLFKCSLLGMTAALLASCGFTNDKPVENQNVYQADQLQSTCKVDGNKLKEFTRLVIPEEISCIEKSLQQYLQLVKTKNPNSINETELNLFITRFFSDQSRELIDGLSVLFETNMLLLRDEQNEISRENLPVLFELLRESNVKIVRINEILDRLSETKKLSFDHPKKISRLEIEIEKFNDEIKDLSEKIVARLESRNRPIQSVILYKYLNETIKKIGADSINTEDIENTIFLKALIVGGDKEIINSEEAKALIRKLPAILDIWANINYFTRDLFKNNQAYANFLKDNIRKIEKNVIATHKTQVELITEKEIEFFIKKIFNKDDLHKNIETFWIAKFLLLGGDDNHVTNLEAQELVTKIPHIIDIWALYQDNPEENFKTKKAYYSFLGSLVEIADQKLIHKDLKDRVILTNEKIQSLAKQFLKKDVALEDLKLLMRLKLIITGSNQELSVSDIYDLLKKLPLFLEQYGELLDHPADSFGTKSEYAQFLNRKIEWMKRLVLSKKIPNTDDILLTNDELKIIADYLLNDPQTLKDQSLTEEEFETLLSLKKMILGQAVDNLTLKEFQILLGKTNVLVSAWGNALDLMKLKFSDKTEYAKKLIDTVRMVTNAVVWNQENYEVINTDKLVSLIRGFITDPDLDIDSFVPSLQSLKTKLIGGDKDSYELKDIKSLFNIVNDFADHFFYDNYMYDQYRQSFESIRGPVRLTPPPTYPIMDQYFSSARKEVLYQDFKLVAENFKYFRNETDLVQHYSFEYIRNKYGFIEVTVLKFLSNKLALAYGHKAPTGVNQVNIEEFEKFLLAMKPILEEFKLWSPKFQTFARNSILLADLFQNQSNGDFEINSLETAEYLSMILSAVEIKGKFEQELVKVCRNLSPNSDEPTYSEPCFKEHYFDIFLNKLNLARYFPRLTDYVKNSPRNEYQDYLKGVVGFARDVDSATIPVNGRDITLVVGAMLNIETTFLRFDTNKNNIISTAELEQAFKIYENAIIAVAKLKPEQVKFSKSIFFYMVINMQVPKTGTILDDASFYLFHKCIESPLCRTARYEPIEAKRLNIGMLLYYLVNLPQ